MILWTIQTIPMWEKLNECGQISGDIAFVYDYMVQSYHWMHTQMCGRIGQPPRQNCFPVWAWYQYEGVGRKRPDLRSSGHLEKNERGVRIEFECDEQEVLLSDFELWHYVLNYWYLPKSIGEGEKFHEALKRKGLCNYKTKPLPHKTYHQKIEKSWARIFDLDWVEPDIAMPKNQKSIQATFWQLNMDQVISYKHFKAR